MKKNYQTTTRRAGTGRTTPKKARPDAQLVAREAAQFFTAAPYGAGLATAVGAYHFLTRARRAYRIFTNPGQTACSARGALRLLASETRPTGFR